MRSTLQTVSVLLPAYNEERILERNVGRVTAALKKLPYRAEILIVDDASKDATPRIARRLAKRSGKGPGIRHLRFIDGPSRRENLGAAFRQAKGDILAFMDIDLATDLAALAELLAPVAKGQADIVIGNRYHRRSKTDRELGRRLYSWAYNTAIRILFLSRFRDHQCGFKAFHKDALMQLLDAAGKDSSRRRGWFWDAELLIRAQRQGLRIREIPVRWTRGEQSSFSFRREVKVIPYMLGLRWRLWRGR